MVVDAGLREIRPFIAPSWPKGVAVTDALLKEIIQSQEKLCGNFGRKRKMIAMGVSRADLIAWPVRYGAADPDATRFVPLDFDTPMSMREILAAHPKGREYGPIVAQFPQFPLLADGKGEVLTFPPVINSALIGGVKLGDTRLFIDLTGPDLQILLTARAIAACDFADMGFTILPVKVEYPYDTPLGRDGDTPYYFQKETTLEVAEAERPRRRASRPRRRPRPSGRWATPCAWRASGSWYRPPPVPERLPAPRRRDRGDHDRPGHGVLRPGDAARLHRRAAHARRGACPAGRATSWSGWATRR